MHDKETVLDDTLRRPQRKGAVEPPAFLRGEFVRRSEGANTPRRNSRTYPDDREAGAKYGWRSGESTLNRHGGGRSGESTPNHLGRSSGGTYDDMSLKRRSRGDSEGRGDRRRVEEKGRGRGRRDSRSRMSGALSDDEGYRRGRNRSKKERHDDREQGRKEDKGRRGKRRPTDIDDFDGDLSEDGSGSDYYSSDYDDSDYSDYDSDDGRSRRRGKLRSSASASEMTNAAWALEGQTGSLDQRIKTQQGQIKKELSFLMQLQKATGMKSLPPQQQKVLEKDLRKLEAIQDRLSEKRGNQDLQMQLLGQQMLLFEHLKEIQTSLQVKPMMAANVPTMSLSHSPQSGNVALQVLQQQQQMLTEQVYVEQQRQMLMAEQQRQMMMAEQQRQMQLAQLQHTQQTQFMGQPQYVMPGLGGLQMYNPGTVAFY